MKACPIIILCILALFYILVLAILLFFFYKNGERLTKAEIKHHLSALNEDDEIPFMK